MPKLFSIPERIPGHIKQIPIYRSTKFKTLSPRESSVAQHFEQRLAKYKEIFHLERNPKDLGDTLFFKEQEVDFEVYKASDSFWWTNRKMAFRETLPRDAKLPEKEMAAEKAQEHLKKLGVDLAQAKIDSVDYTEVIRDYTRTNVIKKQKTAVNVNFTFHMDKIPVVGPGAKIKVSFYDQDKISQVLYFWRNTSVEDEKDTISPDNALEKFMKDPRFIRLDENKASVKLLNIQMGYFALPPFEFQRFLIPVYTIIGNVSTEHLKSYDFTAHVVAIKISPEEVKKAGIVANPNSCQIF